MQDFVGSRLASNINLAVQLVLLAGLLYGYVLARNRQFARHANVQMAMVLLNLLPIAFIMAPGLYGYAVYLREGGTVTFPIAPLMIGHGLLGVAVELYALYLVARMRTRWIPERFRVQNIKLAMRVTLACWIVLVVLGLGIYADRFIVRRVAAAAPLLELRQLGADLYVHAVELQDAVDRGELRRIEAIIRSMTPRERRDPATLNGSRRRRVAAGSGTNLTDVNRLVKQFSEMQKIMKQLSGGGRKGAAAAALMGRR